MKLPFSFSCKRPPTLHLGPLLPDTYERAALWLRHRSKTFLGFLVYLVREEGGKAIAVRQVGERRPLRYLVRPPL